MSEKSYLKNISDDGVCTISLNRPKLHNAFNDEMISELTSLFMDLSEDGSVRLVVLKGEGKSFCAGADLNWMKRMKDYSREENYQDSVKLAGMFEAIDLCRKPVIALVHGASLGGGTGLVSVCDYVLASEETKFGFTEVCLGLLPAVISPFVIAKIGFSQARAHFLSGARFDANRALSMNLIHEVCSLDSLESRGEELIKSFLKAGPEAQINAKKLIRGVRDFTFESDEKVRDFTCQLISNTRISDEGQEGMTALLDKRRPGWIKEK